MSNFFGIVANMERDMLRVGFVFETWFICRAPTNVECGRGPARHERALSMRFDKPI